MPNLFKALPRNRSTIALAAALAASPALAAQNYPPGFASSTFRSLAEVKRAHASCDHLRRASPLSRRTSSMSDRRDISTDSDVICAVHDMIRIVIRKLVRNPPTPLSRAPAFR